MSHGTGNTGGPSPPDPPEKQRGRGGRISSYPWGQLDELSDEEVQAANRLLALIPLGKPGEDLLPALADYLGELTGESHEIFFHDLTIHTEESPRYDFGDSFVTRFHMPPDPEVGAMVVEMSLVERWLNVLQNANQRTVRRMGQLSDRDFGLMTYLILRVLKWLNERGGPPVVFPLEAPDRSILRNNLREATGCVEVDYVVSTDTGTGLARLFLPLQLIHNLEVFADNEAPRRRAQHSLMKGSLSELSLDLSVSLGRVTLQRDEYTGLAPGDVLLPEEHGFRDPVISADDAGGRIYLKLGPECSYLRCVASPTDDGWEITVDETTEYTETRESAMSDDNADGGSTQLLESPEMTVDIQIGQLTLTLRQLGNLQSGQVLKLDQRVGDSVDLIVDGRTVGEGELVNVEGQLGVRLRRVKK